MNTMIPSDGEPVGLERMKKIAEDLFGSIDWDGTTGRLAHCPGEKHHTTPSKEGNCSVFLDNVPTIFCFHQSCSKVIERANHNLRSAIGKGCYNARPISTSERIKRAQHQREVNAARAEDRKLQRATQSLKRRLFTDYAWSLEQALAESPAKLPNNQWNHWRLLLTLFRPDDIIWIGDVIDSGGDYGYLHFKSVERWLRHHKFAPQNFICPSTFNPGTASRSRENVCSWRYWIIESDTLSKKDSLAIFKWLRQFLRLHAIVDTAGKSLHGWFDRRDCDRQWGEGHLEKALAELDVILPDLGCDPRMFQPAQPCRLPGAFRNGNYQHLIWFDYANHHGLPPTPEVYGKYLSGVV